MTAAPVPTPGARVPRVRVRAGAATATARRETNEDTYFAADGLYVVADGMGGHDAGELASRTAVDVLAASLVGRTPRPADVVAVVREANARVRDLAAGHSTRPPGTTVSGVVLTVWQRTPCWIVLNVGDSRTYRMIGGVLEQVTNDHSEVAELVASGVVAPEQALRHPRRNIVTRVLGGVDDAVEPDVLLFPVSQGDRMVVCSDGLSDVLGDARIEAELRLEEDPQAAADRLVAAVLAAGGSDNVTVLVVDAAVGGRSR
ncbi:PP2C family protein-serine/threonine phosphatase [Cellulomonas soli]|uniref:PP2C family protein-serine/threonine phosphatase n=1 Tax=Cellulomonas soli TaxID=931535 RepID=UPI003F834852